MRFHTVGENGVAYLIAFDKHPSDAPEQSDLWQSLPGFREPASKLVRRVLREDVTLRFDEAGKLATARVVELHQNGWAYVQVDPDHALAPVGLVALGVGELLLVERNGATVFPHFSAGELEQIACDTFRHDLQRPMFQRARPDPVDLPPLPKGAPLSTAPRFFEGYDLSLIHI